MRVRGSRTHVLTTEHVRRVDFGYFVRPASEGSSGEPRICPVLGYLIDHPDGLVLFDSGVGTADAETDAHYRPRRRPFVDALRQAGGAVEEVRCIANCHLHFDHCGSNPLFAGRPIVVQAEELVLAHEANYTVTDLIDFPGATYETIDGEVELLPGIWIIPTPGHTAGHQSLVVRCDDGTIIAAGQARDFASDYAAEVGVVLAGDELGADERPAIPDWIARLQQFDPRRIVFAHDLSVVDLTTRGGTSVVISGT